MRGAATMPPAASLRGINQQTSADSLFETMFAQVTDFFTHHCEPARKRWVHAAFVRNNGRFNIDAGVVEIQLTKRWRVEGFRSLSTL